MKYDTGEYGDQIVKGQARYLEGEERSTISGQDIIALLADALARPNMPPIAAEYLLTALMKLATRIPDQSQQIKVRDGLHPRLMGLTCGASFSVLQ